MAPRTVHIDQLHRTITLTDRPKRIVSLVPSQTELLYDLGLSESVVGLTKFCIHPAAWCQTKTIVGGTKKLHLDKIRSLEPDLIIGNKEENEADEVKTLMNEFPVWMSDIYTLADALDMIRSIGKMTQTELAAEQLATGIEEDFKQLEYEASSVPPLRTAYMIWKSPWMAAGNHTFIHDLLRRCGLMNCYGHHDRYPETSLEELIRLRPEIVLLSTEPFPFNQEQASNLRQVLSETKVMLADGEYFSWYGSRLKGAPTYFRRLVNEIRNSGDFN